jgi:hypothetical protein
MQQEAPKGELPMAAKVSQDEARIWIEGLDQYSWGGGRQENSVMGAFNAALQTLGEDVSYEYLMGVSGSAFRVQMSKNGFCPSSPHACCGYKCCEQALQETGWNLRLLPAQNGEEPLSDEAKRALFGQIKKEIDAGRPVLAGAEESSLVVGYLKAEPVPLVRAYCQKGPGYQPMTKWPWGFSVLEKGETPKRKEVLVRSLSRAVELMDAKEFDGYHAGFAAYDSWIDRLRDEIILDNTSESERFAMILGNGQTYYCLLDARFSAAIYLESVADELGADVSPRLRRAAGLYRELVKALGGDKSPTEIAPMPWMLKQRDRTWTKEMRLDQAERLEKAKELDRLAVEEIRGALALTQQ